MEGIIDYLTERRGKWTQLANSEVPLKFNMAIMSSIAKMWMQFIFTHQALTHNASNVTTYQAVMLYSILWKEQICYNHWMYEKMFKCILDVLPTFDYHSMPSSRHSHVPNRAIHETYEERDYGQLIQPVHRTLAKEKLGQGAKNQTTKWMANTHSILGHVRVIPTVRRGGHHR
ncbi:hypothetical protein Golob_013317 [Gossypium lobatum]|uniref:Uncharacterized protein n=1 Tax=Gossypium lobatum TaxID=34289 RepID=A0A7J8LP47_9ROSI|nr:hypothetical protein [Gossypium lobatum]